MRWEYKYEFWWYYRLGEVCKIFRDIQLAIKKSDNLKKANFIREAKKNCFLQHEKLQHEITAFNTADSHKSVHKNT